LTTRDGALHLPCRLEQLSAANRIAAGLI